jgi:hypothetical protein
LATIGSMPSTSSSRPSTDRRLLSTMATMPSTGAKDAAPATLITLGFGLIGLRDRLERGFRGASERR